MKRLSAIAALSFWLLSAPGYAQDWRDAARAALGDLESNAAARERAEAEAARIRELDQRFGVPEWAQSRHDLMVDFYKSQERADRARLDGLLNR